MIGTLCHSRDQANVLDQQNKQNYTKQNNLAFTKYYEPPAWILPNYLHFS